MEPRLFAVVSWGCAATSWLAKALNSHPDVFCTHDANGIWKTHAGAPPINGNDLMAVCHAIGEEVYLAAGDVHGMLRDKIPEVRNKYGARFRAAVVVREPMARLRSQIGLFVQAGYTHWTGLEYLDPQIKSAGLDPVRITVEQRHFAHGVNMLNAVCDEIKVGPIFRMEDITSDAERFLDLFLYLTAEQVPFSPAWAASVVGSKRANEHRPEPVPYSDVEKQIIRGIFKPEAQAIYSELGYPAPEL